MGLQPCPLCILDRVVLCLMGLVFIANFFASGTRARHALSGLNFFFLSFGFLFAGRHVWLQNQPVDLAGECLSFVPSAASVTDIIKEAFQAKTDCALIGWELFGLSIPTLTLLVFFSLFVVLSFQVFGTYQDAHEDSED